LLSINCHAARLQHSPLWIYRTRRSPMMAYAVFKRKKKGLPMMAYAEAVPTLTTLDARGCSHLRSVDSLGLCPALRELFLLECSITDRGIRGLERNQHLCHLDLRRNNELRSVANLANGCRSLQVLYIDCTAVDDAGIAGLEQLPSLRSLSLLDCPVTNPIPLCSSPCSRPCV
jgi:hypothetical protein